jgi:hypothetical protein
MVANNRNAKKACLVALVASGIAQVGAGTDSSITSSFQMRKLKAACRGEEVCLNQVCDPTSFQYNIGNEGEEFPYTVSHSIRRGQIEFSVCPSSSAKAACSSKSGGCSGLTSLKLRMRNDALSMGHDLVSEPEGRMWASCSSHGPGHEWMDSDLGSLGSSPDKSDCETFTVLTAGSKRPSLADICQQKVKVVENSGWTVVDTAAKPNSCLVTMVTANGRVGYAVVGGDKLSPSPPKKDTKASPPPPKEQSTKPASVVTSSGADDSKAPSSASSLTTPASYGTRAGVSSYGARAGVSSYGARRRGLKRDFGGLGGRRMF